MTFSDSNILLRPVSSQDTEQLVSLWNRVFGDPPALIERFLSLLPEMGCGSVAERDSRILGSAYLIHGFELLVPGEASIRCGYLYAVAVDEDSRGKGLGRELSRAAVSYGKENGVELICTLPAEESLYRWYEEILSLRYHSFRTTFTCLELPQALSLSAEEYLDEREALLRGLPHVVPNVAAVTFQQALCEAYGGGLFRFENGIFCAYQEEDHFVVPELLLLDRTQPVPTAFSPAAGPYLCSDIPFPDGFVWNLTFD